MKRRIKLFRFMRINFVMARNGLDQVIFATPWLFPFRFLSYLNPFTWFGRRGIPDGQRIRTMLETLGPIFVKFGQILSTRRDLIPDDIADELEKLQDRVPPFPGEQAKKIIETSLGKPIEEIFQSFTIEPIASASVAQVHAATLHDGKEVVVKVVRPGIKKVIARDVALMYSFAGLVERHWPEGERLHPREVVAVFDHHIHEELDLSVEAANASQLRRNFLHSPDLYVPEVYWEYTSHQVAVFERIKGIPITDVKGLTRHHINLKKLAEKGVTLFFTQVFRDSFFHADMHPGNIFVSKTSPDNPQYIAVDFGIMGTLSSQDQRYLAENLLAFFNRDYHRVAQLHVDSGWVAADTRVEEFESAIRAVCEPIFQKPLGQISFALLVLRLFQTAKRFRMEIQPQLVLLQKTLLNIEGLGRQLYPNLDLWATAKPFLENWLRERVSPKTMIKRVYQQGPFWAEKMVDLPDMVFDALQQLRKQNNNVVKSTIDEQKYHKRLRRSRVWSFVVGVIVTVSLFFILKSFNILL